MPISTEVKYDFTQIKNGLISFIADLELKLQNIIEDLPVMLIQTGDQSYYLDKKFEEILNKEIYQKIPRFIISFEDIQPQTEQNSNQYNIFQFRKDELNYIGKGRRIAQQININTDFISSNFIKALENYEIMSTITSRPNVFTYEFMGNTFEGAYNVGANSMEKPGMDPTSGTRNWSVKTPFELQLHLLIPRLETIKRHGDGGLDNVYDIKTANNEIDKEYEFDSRD